MKKTKLLFVYHRMVIGGSTTSLLSLLHSLDKELYDIDLLLYENKGEFLTDIPSHVNVLDQAKTFNFINIIKMLFSINFYKAIFYKIFKKKTRYAMQHFSFSRICLSRNIKKHYDVSIGFLECWPTYFVLSNKISAQKKIIWIHTDYAKANFLPSFDKIKFLKADQIVLVSNSCKKSFDELFDNLSDKTLVIENKFSRDFLIEKSLKYNVNIRKRKVNFLIVCRMDIITKGLDRLLEVLKRLKEEGYSDYSASFVGSDINNQFITLLEKYKMLSDQVYYYGPTTNPYPYFKEVECCLLLSRYEGKPMVVSEAQLLGVPTIITNYISACEQVCDGVDGLILNNDEDSIYLGLKYILDNPQILEIYRRNLINKDFSSILQIDDLLKIIN